MGAQDLLCLLRSPIHFALLPAFSSGQSVMIQWKTTSSSESFFTRLIVQHMSPVGIHHCLETLMSFASAWVRASSTADPTDSSKHPPVSYIFGLRSILLPGAAAGTSVQELLLSIYCPNPSPGPSTVVCGST